MTRPYADFCVVVVDLANRSQAQNSVRWREVLAAAGVWIGLDRVNPPAPVLTFGHDRLTWMFDPMVLDIASVVVITHQ
jgi:hypothetical protein